MKFIEISYKIFMSLTIILTSFWWIVMSVSFLQETNPHWFVFVLFSIGISGGAIMIPHFGIKEFVKGGI
jgi:hypothetical protein